MSKKLNTSKQIPGFTFVKKLKGISEYTLKTNGLTVLHKEMSDTRVVTSNITYNVGARDELQGESGIAHMLEHMLFKPTKQDLKRKIDSSAMQFERDTGCNLNATTSTDRTTYYFNYPAVYLSRALQIESERMQDVVLSNKEFTPERNNVLSEFDMLNGDPYFALHTQMMCVAFLSHSYGHETIGFREDIEQYTPEKLNLFYKNYYRPDNATLSIIGDVSVEDALTTVKTHFAQLKNPQVTIPRHSIIEPKQEGVRRTEVIRPTSTNILALGVKHTGFPSQDWFTAAILFSILSEGPDSILHKKLVDTGLATSVDSTIAPTTETNLGTIFITLAPDQHHTSTEEKVFEILQSLTTKEIQKLLRSTVASELTDKLFTEGNSLRLAMNLTEYISANAWGKYIQVESILKAITVADVLKLNKTLFDKSQMTIGYFIGEK